MRRFVWACLLLLSAAPAGAVETDQARLDRGEVIVRMRAVEGSTLPMMVGRGVIDVPPVRLWKVVEACGSYVGKLPRVIRSRELSRVGAVAVCETTSQLPFPIGELTSITRAVHETSPGRWVRRWTLVGGDYEDNSGAWILQPFDAAGTRTLLTYEAHVEPKMSVPNAIIHAAQKRGMPTLFDHLRALMRSGGA
ncbi:MAG: SRPBCC family protein [Myxococcota bacterium]